MNTMMLQVSKNPTNYLRLIWNVQRILKNYVPKTPCTTNIDAMNALTSEIIEKHKKKLQSEPIFCYNTYLKSPTKSEQDFTVLNINSLLSEELHNILLDLLSKNKDKEIADIIFKCLDRRKLISEAVLKELLRLYSLQGRSNMVQIIISYCEKINQEIFIRNGEFLHYLAKAQCMKGNSKKGLAILEDCYSRYEPLRSLYRIIFKELIQDTVSNRSEASIVIFKKNVLDFSEIWNDHYPLICMWHICWVSSWFSDQQLSNELFDTSEVLRNIVKDKAMIFSRTALKNYHNDDPVVRLLQSFLKHKLMNEYVNVLQVLFDYKLRNHDIRGCTEIVRNCEVMGLNLPLEQQGRYIQLLIDGYHITPKPVSKSILSKTFKLKF